MNLKPIDQALIFPIIFSIIFLTGVQSHAYNSETPQENKLSSTSKQLNNLDIDQVLKVEAIRKNYQALLSAYREKLTAEQKIFNEGLKVDSNEESIRKAFVPVARAMEDVAVCQIKMIQEINLVLALSKASQTPAENMTQPGQSAETLGANTVPVD